ncbi:hypothetical protein [Aeromicrobium ginsengisoli]|uniref:Gram-positive cocci surface proteins LPxTG domain-containing protein n=1 Tax=Aeromicrobium ginsengisoli TaxID=363867 RepID=A0A5M4FB17_9ACTN|nr:hypothetical protein [Aeromicrobium ginsengisoli]KAA1395515.1 hypothetical protein ESP70_015265 [Aeromicrobium ginsengisoli]
MNRIIRNLIVAAPLATAALTMVSTSAMATDGPVIIAQPHTDPQPPIDDIAIPEPKPVDPKDKVALPEPKPPVDPEDKVAPKPKPTHPDGPDVITNPEPCPTHGTCGNDDKDGPNNGGGKDDSSDETEPVADVAEVPSTDTVKLPTRIDAGLADEQTEGGLELVWLLAGGALVTASGAAIALRARKSHSA